MKRTGILAGKLVLGCIALLSATAWADDDLDVTMQVIDKLSAVDSIVYKTPRPAAGSTDEGADGDDPVAEDAVPGGNLRSEDSPGDDFEYNDPDDDDRERKLATEHVLEDGEEVDYDEYD